jgi:hypothetical protein
MLGRIEIFYAFATSLDTPAHIARAEELGYSGAWSHELDEPGLHMNTRSTSR